MCASVVDTLAPAMAVQGDGAWEPKAGVHNKKHFKSGKSKDGAGKAARCAAAAEPSSGDAADEPVALHLRHLTQPAANHTAVQPEPEPATNSTSQQLRITRGAASRSHPVAADAGGASTAPQPSLPELSSRGAALAGRRDGGGAPASIVARPESDATPAVATAVVADMGPSVCSLLDAVGLVSGEVQRLLPQVQAKAQGQGQPSLLPASGGSGALEGSASAPLVPARNRNRKGIPHRSRMEDEAPAEEPAKPVGQPGWKVGAAGMGTGVVHRRISLGLVLPCLMFT